MHSVVVGRMGTLLPESSGYSSCLDPRDAHTLASSCRLATPVEEARGSKAVGSVIRKPVAAGLQTRHPPQDYLDLSMPGTRNQEIHVPGIRTGTIIYVAMYTFDVSQKLSGGSVLHVSC